MSCYVKSESDGDPREQSAKCQSCSFKLDSFDWMNRLKDIDKENVPELVEVRFKNTRKGFFRNVNRVPLEVGDCVVVECPTGYDTGLVSLVSDLVNIKLFKSEINSRSEKVFNLDRLATKKDIENWKHYRDLEHETMIQARKNAKELGLDMKINDVEYQTDGKKATFYYTADGRIDFRELIKIFARNFRTKIEMRQIGIRQEAGRVGGIGDCGRELCCSTWLTDFTTVPTIAAKQQNLYLNPSKLSGQCGRLKCCLNYELDNYMEALEEFPDDDIILKTQEGSARIFKLDILKGIIWFLYRVNDNTTGPFPIKLDQVNRILDLNKKKKYPKDLSKYILQIETKNDDGEIDLY